MKIYVSQSTQHSNVGVGGYGIESDRMGRIANGAVRHLERNGFTVLRNSGVMTLAETVADSNNKCADLHVACHSNANDTVSRGCEVWYKSAKGKCLANAMYQQVTPLTPTGDRGIKQTDSFYELNNTNAVACLIEFMFHDNLADANYIINHMEELAEAVAKGVCDYYGKAYIPLAKPVVDSGHIYRVQVGAYSVQANAQALVNELKAKGYDPIIKED